MCIYFPHIVIIDAFEWFFFLLKNIRQQHDIKIN